jgi:5-methylcytosine-specific restriction endonuclease McrA
MMNKSPHFGMLDRIRAQTEPKKKLKIPSKVRGDVWNTYIGAQMAQHRCICCKKVTIKQTEFEVGHVISEKNGGTLEINNLRPICSVCNKSMGCMNMVEFVKTYGYFI